MRDVILQPDASETWASLDVSSPRMRAGISLARAGDMAVGFRHELPFRRRILQAAGVPEPCFGLRQVHSRVVVEVTDQEPEQLAELAADGMIADRAGLTLTVTIGDCLPIFLVDTRSGAFGLVHSGWRGTGIVKDALAAMTARYATRPADVAATIGPGIGTCCYRVPEERASAFAENFGNGAVTRGADGAPRLDLRAANVGLLRQAGVLDIGVVAECTCCSPRLSSFRRQGPEAYTLMLAFLTRG
jgi:polyphenol oxidase